MFRTRLIFAGMLAGALGWLGGCNSEPVASPDIAVAEPGRATNIDVLANDRDPDNDPLIVKRLTHKPRQGSAVINSDNTITYTPNSGAVGSDEFEYRVRDNHGHAKNARVVVDIEPPVPTRPLVLAPPPTPVTVYATPEPVVVRTPAATPALPAPPPPGTPMINSATVTLHTTNDDKNREDPVRIVLRRNQEVVGERTLGVGELWNSDSDRTFDIPLNPGVPLSDAGLLTLEVHKPPATGLGSGWAMQVDLQGHLSDGTTVTLLPRTEPVKLGDGEPSDRTWALPARR